MSNLAQEKRIFEEITTNIDLKSSFAEKSSIEKNNIDNIKQVGEPSKCAVEENKASSPSDVNKFSDGLACVQQSSVVTVWDVAAPEKQISRT